MSLVRQIHAWSGVVLALVLALIGLSGTVSVFRGEIIRATVPAARAAAPPAASFGPALDRLEAGGVKVRSAKFRPYGLGVHGVGLADGAGFIDGEGRLVQHWDEHGRVEDLILVLHHQLLAGDRGEQAVGLIGLLGIGMVLSGLAIWAWPRPRLSFRLWPRGTTRRELLDVHRSLGPLLALFLLIQMATGAGMALDKLARPLFGAQRPPPPRVMAVAGPVSWTRILSAAQAAYPQAEIRRVFAPFRPGAPYVVGMQQPGDLNPEGGTTVFVDGGGAIAGRIDERRQGPGAQLYNAFLGIHSGAWGGTGGRLLSALVGLGLTTLGLLGALAFLKRRRPA